MSLTVAAFVTFNLYVSMFASQIAPNERVFVGAQFSPATNADSWTKYAPDSDVFIIQISQRAAEFDEEHLKIMAAHELAHVRLDGAFMREAAKHPGAVITPWERHKHEVNAMKFAAEFLNVSGGLEK